MNFLARAGWADALIFAIVVIGLLFVLAWLLRRWHDMNYMRIPSKRLDWAQRTGQFSTPWAQRDKKAGLL